MNSRARLFIFNSILIAILFCSVSTTTAYTTRDWKVGDVFYYTYIYSEKDITVNKIDEVQDAVTSSIETEYKYVLTDIDEISKEVSLNVSIPWGLFPYDMDYDTSNTSLLLIDQLFHFQYNMDYSTNESRLTDFYMLGDTFTFVVEPDWDLFNIVLANVSDRDRQIDWLPTMNITFGDFIDSVPFYQITGIKGFPGNTEEQGPVYEWKLEFNLANVIYRHEVFIHQPSTFTPYSQYNATAILRFTEGGTLIESAYHEVKIIEGETYSTETVISFYNVELRASETSINFYTTSITIMVIPLLAYVFKRRKK